MTFVAFISLELSAEIIEKKLNAKGSVIYLLESSDHGNIYQLTTVDAKGNRSVSLWNKGIPESLFVEKVDYINRTISSYMDCRDKNKKWSAFKDHINPEDFARKKNKIITAQETTLVDFTFDESKKQFVEIKRQTQKTGHEY
jgi:hypothetical protein